MYLHDPHDAGFIAVGMVEERKIAFFHLVSHEIAGLVVSDAVPVVGLLFLQVVEAVNVGLAFH